jgi:hypothetical protein
MDEKDEVRYTVRWSRARQRRVKMAAARLGLKNMQDAIFEALDQWLPKQLAGPRVEGVPKSEQGFVCPHCESISYAGCEHSMKALAALSVPETENFNDLVNFRLEYRQEQMTAVGDDPALGAWITMLVRILQSGDRDAPGAVQSNLRTFYRLIGGDPDAALAAARNTALAQRGQRSIGPRRYAADDSADDRDIRPEETGTA